MTKARLHDMSPILVTGATGLVGNLVVHLSRSAGLAVRAMVRPNADLSGFSGLDVEFVEADITDPSSVRAAVEGCGSIVHCAALVPGTTDVVEDFTRVNVGGTESIVEAARSAGVSRLVHVSTVNALASTPGEVVDETSPPPDDPHAGYDASKLQAEKIVLDAARAGLNAVVVNPAIVFGPGSRSLGRVISMFLSGRLPAIPLPKRRLSIVFAPDVARGCLLALEKGRSGERYILANPPLTISDFFDELSSVSGRKKPVLTMPKWLATAAVSIAWAAHPVTRWRPPITVAGIRKGGAIYDGSKAGRELGLDYTPLREALEATVSSMRGAISN